MSKQNASTSSKKSSKSKKSTKSTEQKTKQSGKSLKSKDKPKVDLNRPRSPVLPVGKTRPRTPITPNYKKSVKSRKSSKKPAVKSANANRDEKAKSKSSKKAPSAVTVEASTVTDVAVQLESARRQMQQLDNEYRAKVEEETIQYERLEAEQMEMLHEKHMAALESKIKQIQDIFQTKIECTRQDLEKKQQKELIRLQTEESKATKNQNKQTELEKEIKDKQDEAQADIDQYKEKRQAEMEEQIKNLRQQCERDIEEYSARRLQNNQQLLEQIKQKLELEIRNDEQQIKLSMTLKMEKVKERYAKMITDEIGQLNQEMTQAIAEQRAVNEEETGKKRVESKKALHKELEAVRARLDEEFKQERTKLKAHIEALEAIMKGNLKQEQRNLERRKKMKQELLAMLAMDDMWRLTDEELITRRHKFNIERGTIVQQSAASTIYRASKGDQGQLYCKVTMFEKWSIRHRTDFGKYSTRLARYLTINKDKVPYFVQVVDVLATDLKVYTFMLPLKSSKTLQAHLDSLGGSKVKKKKPRSKPKSAQSQAGVCLTLQKAEVHNVLNQVVAALRYLNSMFVAHGNLTADNITLIGSRDDDLYDCKLVITGLTRPIVYYNVESDTIVAVKGLETASAESLDSMDHLPPECFESEFIPSHLDAYSIGVLAYQLLRLSSPFSKVPTKKILSIKQANSVKLALEGKAEEEHAQLPALVAALTQPVQHSRLQIEDILGDAYFM